MQYRTIEGITTVRILQRVKGVKGWKVIESAEYRGEAELQHLLNESPSLIPIDDIREGASPMIVAVREFGLPGAGNTDLLCFSAEGDIAVIECKLAANAEIKRKVIGQILEYAAYLWRMSYEELDQRVQAKRGKPLATLVNDAVASSDWDEENFRTAVQESLRKGSFILLIAVDTINEELSRTISFLNGCGDPGFSFCALESVDLKVTQVKRWFLTYTAQRKHALPENHPVEGNGQKQISSQTRRNCRPKRSMSSRTSTNGRRRTRRVSDLARARPTVHSRSTMRRTRGGCPFLACSRGGHFA